MTFLVCCILGVYFLMVMELFLPTGGSIGLCAVAVALFTIGHAFTFGVGTGTFVLVWFAVTLPATAVGMFRLWPHTPIGKRVLNRPLGGRPTSSPKRLTPAGEPLESLVGKYGITVTELIPNGIVKIEGQNFDVVNPGGPVATGERVKVTAVDSSRILVIPSDEASVQERDEVRVLGRPSDQPLSTKEQKVGRTAEHPEANQTEGLVQRGGSAERTARILEAELESLNDVEMESEDMDSSDESQWPE